MEKVMEFEELKRARTLIIRSGHPSDFTHVKVAVAHGEANFCVWPISQDEIASGEVVKKNKRILPMTVPDVSCMG